jgi:hypothetical protein
MPVIAQLLSAEEELLVDKAIIYLKEKNSQDCILIQERLKRLRNLGEAVFDYPSIKNTEFLKGILSNENPLSENLLSFSSSANILRIPTKVVALRSFLVAKFHCFSLLTNLTISRIDLYTPLKIITFSVICTLMAEDVYFSCLDDPGFSSDTKAKLSDDLINLWDSGIDSRSIRHLMALSSLWSARDTAPPSFGTMDGNTELIRISIDLENDWEDFLVEESTNDETRWALEEFLFALSYEEIKQIRTRLARYGVSSVDYNEVRSFLSSKPAYSLVAEHDPKAMYDFFIERKDSCILRKRISAPGPLHTLEELYLKYRIILEAG